MVEVDVLFAILCPIKSPPNLSDSTVLKARYIFESHNHEILKIDEDQILVSKMVLSFPDAHLNVSFSDGLDQLSQIPTIFMSRRMITKKNSGTILWRSETSTADLKECLKDSRFFKTSLCFLGECCSRNISCAAKIHPAFHQ